MPKVGIPKKTGVRLPDGSRIWGWRPAPLSFLGICRWSPSWQCRREGEMSWTLPTHPVDVGGSSDPSAYTLSRCLDHQFIYIFIYISIYIYLVNISILIYLYLSIHLYLSIYISYFNKSRVFLQQMIHLTRHFWLSEYLHVAQFANSTLKISNYHKK